jgi:4-hydroxy-tetrahydrodipicolinate synthase
MNLLGFNVGKCRLPLVEISETGMNQLKRAMSEYGLI